MAVLKNPRFPIALVKRLCPVCCKEHDSEILMSTRGVRVPEGQHDIDKMHNKAIGFSDKPCEECLKQIGDKGAYLVGIVPEKSEDMRNPYRSGHVAGVAWRLIDEVFTGEHNAFIHKNLWIFAEEKAMRILGVIQ